LQVRGSRIPAQLYKKIGFGHAGFMQLKQ
jgi:hypothetical protein